MDRAAVESLLRDRIGLDPTSAGNGLVERAVRVRMIALGIAQANRAEYFERLNHDPLEAQALIEEVVVSESWFFRDEHPFDFLKTTIAPRWLNDPGRPRLRILSVPCAGGEEPYSIAIALLDRGLPASRFQIVGVDVSRRALDIARRGVYSENAFRSQHREFRDRHFQRKGTGYELNPAVRGTVVFRQGNLIDPAMLLGEAPYDILFCRNLLIYLDEPSRRRALANIDRLLAPSGIVFIGHAEHIRSSGIPFRPSGDSKCFAFERATSAAVASPRSKPATASRPQILKPSRTPQVRMVSLDAGTARPPASSLDRADVSPPKAELPDSVAALDDAARLADLGRHDEAARACEHLIRTRGASPQAYFLLGLIRQAAGDRPQAEGCFEKVVYLDPRHEDALLSLALLAQRRGDPAAAENFRRRAERASHERSRP